MNLYCFLISVCNAGYYKNGTECDLCTGNTIKSMIGDVMDCNDDEPCDGVSKAPDANHKKCGV